ncbi:MAG: hypothetical protein L3K08_05855, partial [Thermoplasmata archaeon]|nr:hypothetical protein [Thermoplasmata archaeon]
AQTAIYAYGSWLSYAALLGLLFLTFAGGFGENPLESSGGAAQGPGVTAIGGLIALVLIMGVGLRALYHRTLAATASAARGDSPPTTRPADWSKIRTDLGAVLLVWNPLAGLLLGVALPGVFPWGPLAVAEASLPITLLGIALLAGGFGRTLWVPSSTGSPVGTVR